MLEFCAASLAAQNFAVAPALRSHVDSLCAEELDGRLAGSAGERAAARYLYSALREAGVLMLTDSLGQDFRIAGNAGSDEIASQNIVGIVEGADPQLREEYIVVGARYDHLGTHTLMIDGEPVVQVFPGADANASGVAVLIELARMVAQYQGLFRRSILFVIAAYLAGDTLIDAAVAFGRVEQVGVGVRMDVDEARRYDETFRIHKGRRIGSQIFADSCDLPVPDGDVALDRVLSVPGMDDTVLDDGVKRIRSLYLASRHTGQAEGCSTEYGSLEEVSSVHGIIVF